MQWPRKWPAKGRVDLVRDDCHSTRIGSRTAAQSKENVLSLNQKRRGYQRRVTEEEVSYDLNKLQECEGGTTEQRRGRLYKGVGYALPDGWDAIPRGGEKWA